MNTKLRRHDWNDDWWGDGTLMGPPDRRFFRRISASKGVDRNIVTVIRDSVKIFLNKGSDVMVDGSKVILKPSAGGEYHQATDPLVPTSEVNGFAFDMGFGTWYSRPDYYLGFSILHLFAPKPNFKDELDVYIPRSFFLTGGYNYKFLEKPIELQPSVFLKQSSGSWQMDLNVNLMFQEKYWTGLTYRLQDAVVLFAGIELKNGIKIGYSYDITTSALSGAGSNGSHEIMVGYRFDVSTEKREKRYKSVRYL